MQKERVIEAICKAVDKYVSQMCFGKCIVSEVNIDFEFKFEAGGRATLPISIGKAELGK
jgi:hypothetical protein